MNKYTVWNLALQLDSCKICEFTNSCKSILNWSKELLWLWKKLQLINPITDQVFIESTCPFENSKYFICLLATGTGLTLLLGHLPTAIKENEISCLGTHPPITLIYCKLLVPPQGLLLTSQSTRLLYAVVSTDLNVGEYWLKSPPFNVFLHESWFAKQVS